MDAYTLRERAWHHFELGNFDTANLLFGRARELEVAAPAADTAVIL